MPHGLLRCYCTYGVSMERVFDRINPIINLQTRNIFLNLSLGLIENTQLILHHCDTFYKNEVLTYMY